MAMRNKNGRLERGELRIEVNGGQMIFNGLMSRSKEDARRVNLRSKSDGTGDGQVWMEGMTEDVVCTYEIQEMSQEEFDTLDDCWLNIKRVTATWVERDTGRMFIQDKAVIKEPLDNGSQEVNGEPENIKLVLGSTRQNDVKKNFE